MGLSIKSYSGVKTSKYPPSKTLLNEAQGALKFTFGKMMEMYLLDCGYLEFSFVVIYGIYANKGLESDLIVKTLSLHKRYPQLEHYVVIEDKGDGDYILCDENDNIYNFIPTCSSDIKPLPYKLFDYFFQRYNEANT